MSRLIWPSPQQHVAVGKHSIHIKHNPLHTAGFCVDLSQDKDISSTRIFLSSRRPYYHTYNPTTTTLQRITRPLYDSTPQSKLPSTTTKPPKPHHKQL